MKSCREALTSTGSTSFHLLEQINIDLQVQNSIVPSAFKLARFKVSGKLPSLQVNLSDTKYKSLMRLIDVCIPKLGDGSDLSASLNAPAVAAPTFPLTQAGLFSTEYHVEDENDDQDDASTSREEQFFEAEEGMPEVLILYCLTRPLT